MTDGYRCAMPTVDAAGTTFSYRESGARGETLVFMLEVMSGVGHVPQLERPAAFADMARFLADGVVTFRTLLERAASWRGTRP
jgi:hypothetical protein